MDEAPPRAVPRGRLIAYYVLLALAVGAVAVIVLAVVPKPKAQPSIAGGYDLVPPNGCLGKQVNLSQSRRCRAPRAGTCASRTAA